jgi:hypothetical protein
MKLSRNNIRRNCLSSDIVSIAFAHFLITVHPSPEYDIQFFSIDTPENLVPASQKASHRQPDESVRVFL